ncbi:LysR family transcriptional regulator [Pararobbsia silviterrae]|uniref:LysR family transcriptional regulator n=1 Tax=Pararobbsia silviterrae TaxID=1792498 RepID=A0A494XRP5_9BURK|nr:LysR family transcriptional regulator [Pararobbsia silviterrae]RKP53317.1 LysR family transcriptional regulator [Pararobbsia silviterrae]
MIAFSRFTGYFNAIIEHGSIRKAADALHVSASAIDRQILQAEEALGAPLFERMSGGLRPTAAGEVFVALVREWQRDYRRALTQIDELQGLRRGHVDIAIIDALTQSFVAPVIATLAKERPGLTVGVRVLDNEAVAQSTASGDVDFGLMLNPRSMKDLEVRRSIDAPLGIAFRPGHAFEARKEVRLSQSLDERLIVPAAPLVIHEHVAALFRRSEIDIQRFMACNNTHMMRSLVDHDVGVAVLCWLDVASDVASGKLGFRKLKDAHVEPLRLHLCVAPRRQLSHAATEVLRYVEAGMRDAHTPRSISGR